MPLQHGVVKSGNSRIVNKMGNTNRMIAYVTRHRSSKPVSINYLRGMLKNLTASIDSLAHDPQAQTNAIRQKSHVFNAIKGFQAAYAVGDMSASVVRNYCRMNGVPLRDDVTPTMRVSRDNVQRIASMLGDGSFDDAGIHFVSKEGKPKIPGGYASVNEHQGVCIRCEKSDCTCTAEQLAKPNVHSSSIFVAKSPEYHAEGRVKMQPYLQRILRQSSSADYKKAVRGTRNTFVNRMTGKSEMIPNPPVKKDKVAR